MTQNENSKKKLLSVIVPVFNEQDTVAIFYETVEKYVPELDVDIEYLFVDDGSKDSTLSIIKELAEKDDRVHYVSFSRNFGKEAALYAGLENSVGDYVVLMDVDLQDPPELLPQMLKEIEENGYDCIGTRRVTRKGEPPIRSFFARRFYKLINAISKTEIVDGARDYQMMTRQVVDAILSIGEYNRFSKGIFGWVGYRKKWIEYENIERVAGETKWSFWKLFVYAIDGIVAYSTVPLVLASVIGLLLCFASVVVFIVALVKAIMYHISFFSLTSLILMLSGIELFFMGVLGQYLAKTYLEAKHRPIYLAREQKVAKKDK